MTYHKIHRFFLLLLCKYVISHENSLFLAGSYEFIKVEKTGAGKTVAVIQLNRPKALNALCNGLMSEVSNAIDSIEKDSSVGAIIITGSEKAFAAGADIKEMQNNTYSRNIRGNFLAHWDRVAKCSKPVIAAVNGYAVSCKEGRLVIY